MRLDICAEIDFACVQIRVESDFVKNSIRNILNALIAVILRHLAFAGLCLCQAPQQEFEFFFPTDELGQCAPVQTAAVAKPGHADTGDSGY